MITAFKNMRLSVKLIAGFIIVSLFAGGVGVYAGTIGTIGVVVALVMAAVVIPVFLGISIARSASKPINSLSGQLAKR